jgi:endonuclease YncB( thermonuclease family)
MTANLGTTKASDLSAQRNGVHTFLRRILILVKTSMLVLFLLGIYLAADHSGLLSGNSTNTSKSAARSVSAHPNLSRVIDADTIFVGDVHVRLDGISAPERGHDKYIKGRWFIEDLMGTASSVECDLEGRKSYDREVGACFFIMSDGQRIDPQAEAVKAGFARDCPRYSGGRYTKFETLESRALPLPPYCD